MNKLCCLLIIIVSFKVCDAQNLVPNPSFEDTIGCPTHFSSLIDETLNAPPWHRITLGTSDYFNQCNDSIVSVPFNFMGYQPAKTGVAYMGMFTFENFREYISAPLLNSLAAGTVYYGSMFVSLGCNPAYVCPTGADRIGIYFSIGIPDTTGVFAGVIPVIPQIENPSGNMLTDTLSWIKISSSFIATGGENYITIGNFSDSANTNGSAYYYIDDVCLSLDSNCFTSTKDINEIGNVEEFTLFPIPFFDIINITTKRNEYAQIIIYDIFSRQLLQQTFMNSTTLNTEQLAKGIYIYEVRNKNGVIQNGKVMK